MAAHESVQPPPGLDTQASPLMSVTLVSKLTEEIKSLGSIWDSEQVDRERASRRIQLTIAGVVRRLRLGGEVMTFGSFTNGFKTGASDIDVVLLSPLGQDSIVPSLGKFAKIVNKVGFENTTKIFQANVPLVKCTDTKSGMEVDFCVNNELGYWNSLLLQAYCKCDPRVAVLGRMVKEWGKTHELVGTADGCLNSYAYILLVLHYLQGLTPPVVPNLQKLCTAPRLVVDRKWGSEDQWDVRFLQDVSSLPPSENTLSLGELLIGFFNYYGYIFDWRHNAVCMRLNGSGEQINKFSLTVPASEEQWYVEDPFDLKHNLAGKCSRAGKTRIIEQMCETLKSLVAGHTWATVCPNTELTAFYLKCRVSLAVTPQALLEEFEEFGLAKLHFPKSDGTGRPGSAFLEFASVRARRKAHTKNECYVADCQLCLHYTSQLSLADCVQVLPYFTYEMASYKMQRRVVEARVRSFTLEEEHSREPPDISQVTAWTGEGEVGPQAKQIYSVAQLAQVQSMAAFAGAAGLQHGGFVEADAMAKASSGGFPRPGQHLRGIGSALRGPPQGPQKPGPPPPPPGPPPIGTPSLLDHYRQMPGNMHGASNSMDWMAPAPKRLPKAQLQPGPPSPKLVPGPFVGGAGLVQEPYKAGQVAEGYVGRTPPLMQKATGPKEMAAPKGKGLAPKASTSSPSDPSVPAPRFGVVSALTPIPPGALGAVIGGGPPGGRKQSKGTAEEGGVAASHKAAAGKAPSSKASANAKAFAKTRGPPISLREGSPPNGLWFSAKLHMPTAEEREGRVLDASSRALLERIRKTLQAFPVDFGTLTDRINLEVEFEKGEVRYIPGASPSADTRMRPEAVHKLMEVLRLDRARKQATTRL